MVDRSIPGATAFAHAMHSPNARWEPARFDSPFLQLAHQPKFELSPRDRFFCVGSCFAREIEEALICRNVEVLSKRIISPKEEYAARPNGIVNKFTTPSIVNELKWSLLKQGSGSASIVEAGDGFKDLQLVPNSPSVSFERAEQRRAYMEGEYFARIQTADVVIVTLGLIETWRDTATDTWLYAPPPFYLVRREPDRFTLVLTSVTQNLAALEEIHAILERTRPEIRIIVTVSPVPLETSFSGEDIIIANTRSKSVLRAAAWELASAHQNVDYFPSFEFVMNGARAQTFAPDGVHVRRSVIDRIVDRFAELYIPGASPRDMHFVEALYLSANPDVLEGIRAGEIVSGFHHWRDIGQAEGRALCPQEIPERLYRSGEVE